MTMRVTVANEDAGRVITVAEETFTIGEGPLPTSRDLTEIGPGGKRTFYVHAAKRLLITEDPLSSR